jgi:hypothetical protein
MKVKIGPYSNWWGPYQIADLLQKVGVSEDACHKLGDFLNATPLASICEWIHSKKNRTMKVRIDRYDTWSMDETLVPIILPMLKQLKETKHGSPGNMPAFNFTSNSAQGCFDFYAEGDDTAWEEGHNQWVAILDKMIWSFEQLRPGYDWEEQFQSGESDIQWVDIDETTIDPTTGKETTLSEMVCGPNDTFTYDVVGALAFSQRIQEGLTLFGLYYCNLWD